MKKVLVIASVASMIDQFNMDNIRILQNLDFEVHVGTNFSFGSTSSKERIDKFKKELANMNVLAFDLPFPRKIGSLTKNILVYRIIKKLIKHNSYDLIHVHSPIGGFIGRLAAFDVRKVGTKVIYTAHGFHFFKGAPIISWIVFYPIEYFLSFLTDIIITINKEDYERAQKFHSKKVIYIPGVGVNIDKFSFTSVNLGVKRHELGVPVDSFLILSVGEINSRKNHEVIIRAISHLKDLNIYYVICGIGSEENRLRKLCLELGLEKQILFAGYREDINEIVKIADCFAFPSKREGLGIAALEAMAVGLPIITSNVNGIMDYSIDGKTGFVCHPNDDKGFSLAIRKLVSNTLLTKEIKDFNFNKVKEFSSLKVNSIMESVYSGV